MDRTDAAAAWSRFAAGVQPQFFDQTEAHLSVTRMLSGEGSALEHLLD